ncbi:nitrogen fixation protein NifH [Dehalogenimonas sp. THU2]|uniref:nitrogen fixation protein NifH n=1 Tax=Dehalogenimonas sp. THU2 TaxID=3151121 RepID=UPI003218215A
MTQWQSMLKGDSLSWLLEPDTENPAVRYLALRDIVGLPQDSSELLEAKTKAMTTGTITAVLDNQRPTGYWVKPGGGYGPKYTGSVWSLVTLAQMGADKSEPRVRQAAAYLLDHTVSPVGWFSYNGTNSGFLHCHAGYLGAAMFALGFGDDLRVTAAIDWQARMITGEGIAEAGSEESARYYHYTTGPGFICSANANKPCAWGAVKAMRALGSVPGGQRTLAMDSAIDRGRQFLLNTDLTVCDFPTRDKTKASGNWFKFGFPLLYVADLLELIEVLTVLGGGGDLRLEKTWKLVLDKQDDQGRWAMDYSYNGKLWSGIEVKGEPSKWVTLRVLRVLKRAFPN